MTFIIDYYPDYSGDQFILSDVHPSVARQSAAGQTFTVEDSCLITSAKFRMWKSGTPNGKLTYKIYKHMGTFGTTGLPTGIALGVSNEKDITNLTGAWEIVELTFTPAVFLPAGHYCIALVIDSGVLSASNSVHISTDATTPTHSGISFKWEAGAWSVEAGWDTYFYVYGEYLEGKFNETKKALINTIKLAIEDCYPLLTATVEGNWRQDINDMVRDLPFVTVRLSEVLSDVYDRNVGESTEGSIADYHFSAFVFHSNCNLTGEEKGKYAQDVADCIINHLVSQPSDIGFDIYGVISRESEPERGGHRISRVIIEGQIHIKRID